MHRSTLFAFVTTCILACSATKTTDAAEFTSRFANTHDRVWLGQDYWANPMEDWRVQDGRLECLNSGGNRNVHLLTYQLNEKNGAFTMRVRVGRLAKGAGKSSAGFRVGIRDNEVNDHRAWLIYGQGLNAGITDQGTLFIGQTRGKKTVSKLWSNKKGIVLTLRANPNAGIDKYTLEISAHLPGSNNPLASLTARTITKDKLHGNIALVNNHFGKAKGKRSRYWFAEWKVSGKKVTATPAHAFGPICWSMYTLSRGVLKMTAQMPPVGAKDSQQVRLQIKNGDAWKTISEAKIAPLSFTATFRVAKWNDKKDIPYRLAYTAAKKDGTTSEAYWTGTVRKDPIDKKSIVVAGFTGNADYGFPNLQLVKNVKHMQPDVLFFSGDQIYEYVGGYGIVRFPVVRACLNYLRKWFLVGLAYREIMRDRPVVCIPDDHDVYQGNIWGNGGNPIPLRLHDAGGYVQHRDFVNCVHRTQCAHLPNPYDPRPIKQNISVYYSSMLYGKIDFAIIADRMFKSGPRHVATWKGRPDHLKDAKYDLKKLDKPGLKMLGDRQLKFLNHWVSDWKGVDMRCVLSQTNFCNVANYHGRNRMYLVGDLDSGGWPQSARNRALAVMRKGFAFHYNGDQHLATIVQYGIDAPGDAGYSFCVPSIANFYPRRWIPDEEGKPVKNRPQDGLPNTGDYRDGLGNHIRVVAVGNPKEKYRKGRLPGLHDKASGFGIVRFHRDKQTITMECYQLLVDVSDNKTKGDQFPGWPKTISMTDNYGRQAIGHLPTVKVRGMVDPVVQVIAEKNKEIVYTLRIKGAEFRPPVFVAGRYTVRVGELGTTNVREFRGVEVAKNRNAVLETNLGG